jgi:hypothetical protein
MTMRLIRHGVVVMVAMMMSACRPAPPPPSGETPPTSEDNVGDPLQSLPDNYRLEFENDYVKIVRVHYDAGSELPEHIHPAGSTLFIYLNENEKVIFRHALTGGEAPLVRPPVKAGGVRFATSYEEHHTMENPSPTPSDFLRILVKTDSLDLGSALRRRIALSEKEYANKQLRVTRPPIQAGKPLELAPSDHPSLIVAWPSGKHYWIEPKGPVSIPTGDAGTEGFVRAEFLTKPVH